MTAESWAETRGRLETREWALSEAPLLEAALTRIDDLERALRNLIIYGMIHTVKNLRYAEGTHAECLEEARRLLGEGNDD